jgi:DTW domain-containing protein YfiP
VNLSNESLPETQKRFRSDKNWVIFVIDGTWFLAKKMLKRNPTITSLPQICFTPKVASQYRIRLQPHPYCLSTIEAVHHLISLLEPEINPDNLLEVFCGMVNRQLSYFAPSSK